MSTETRWTFETDNAEVDYEDGGNAAIIGIDHADATDKGGAFVRLQSWSETGEHPFVDALAGRRVRVIVEVI